MKHVDGRPWNEKAAEKPQGMTIEEAIKDIKTTIQPVAGGISLVMAIQALEKQIPKRPLEVQYYKSFGKCPLCEQVVSARSAKNFCQYCGQAIDWRTKE
jgi:Zn finger protein HypA/HybF involved in hydrogenase expression